MPTMNLSTYLRDIRKELSLTTFPKQDVIINFTLFVIIFTAIMAVYLGALDLFFGEAVLSGINKLKIAVPVVQPVVDTIPQATTSLINATTSI